MRHSFLTRDAEISKGLGASQGNMAWPEKGHREYFSQSLSPSP